MEKTHKKSALLGLIFSKKETFITGTIDKFDRIKIWPAPAPGDRQHWTEDDSLGTGGLLGAIDAMIPDAQSPLLTEER